ncbi:hypothetical protein KUTeg_015464 [Tegillarca granosa]|uniref:Uncharacterized protein n=1 Tax=Tegillarca granosa TaxID=220873 RepID=A0ABQ9EVF4_TEGGR|nr:hypothetical protein KUTeg_015464 [Tegillarca granosa]
MNGYVKNEMLVDNENNSHSPTCNNTIIPTKTDTSEFSSDVQKMKETGRVDSYKEARALKDIEDLVTENVSPSETILGVNNLASSSPTCDKRYLSMPVITDCDMTTESSDLDKISNTSVTQKSSPMTSPNQGSDVSRGQSMAADKENGQNSLVSVSKNCEIKTNSDSLLLQANSFTDTTPVPVGSVPPVVHRQHSDDFNSHNADTVVGVTGSDSSESLSPGIRPFKGNPSTKYSNRRSYGNHAKTMSDIQSGNMFPCDNKSQNGIAFQPNFRQTISSPSIEYTSRNNGFMASGPDLNTNMRPEIYSDSICDRTGANNNWDYSNSNNSGFNYVNPGMPPFTSSYQYRMNLSSMSSDNIYPQNISRFNTLVSSENAGSVNVGRMYNANHMNKSAMYPHQTVSNNLHPSNLFYGSNYNESYSPQVNQVMTSQTCSRQISGESAAANRMFTGNGLDNDFHPEQYQNTFPYHEPVSTDFTSIFSDYCNSQQPEYQTI